MSILKYRLELPPEAETARDFIEALVARYKSQIDELKQEVQTLSEQVQSPTERLQKLNPRNSSVAPCKGIWHMAKTFVSGVGMTNARLADQAVLSLKTLLVDLAPLQGTAKCGPACYVV